MLDYKLLEAFYFVVTEGGFEKASNKLSITQSAVSQRVKLLEEQSGQILLIRSNPPKATIVGENFLNHFRSVKNLENNLYQIGEDNYTDSISIGLNADSLATWFMPISHRFLPSNRVLDLNIDDQDRTIEFLKSGEVVAAISTHNKSVQGCKIEKLGTMEYKLLSTPEFYKKWFNSGFSIETVNKAPAVLFNKNDKLHDDYLKKYFDTIPDYNCNYIPSSEQFLNNVLNDRAYGLIPLLQCEELIEDGNLIEVNPNISIHVELYLHRWNNLPESTERFLNSIVDNIQYFLF